MARQRSDDPDPTWLLQVAARLAGPEGEDIAQDTWLAAQQHRPDPSRSMRPWLSVVARRAAWMLRRRRARWHANAWRLADDPPVEDPDAVLHRSDVLDAVKSALDGLATTDREVVVRRLLLDQSTAQVAQELNLQPGAVRTRLHRALERLRVDLDRRFGGREAWAAGLLLPWDREAATASGTGVALVAATIAIAAVVGVVVFVARDRDPTPTPSANAVAATIDDDVGGATAGLRDPADPSSAPRPESKRSSDAMRRLLAANNDKPAEGPPLPRTSSGVLGDIKAMLPGVKDALASCVGPPDGGGGGRLELDVQLISEPDIGTIVGTVDVVDDTDVDPARRECVAEALRGFAGPATRESLDQAFRVRVDLEGRNVSLHGSFVVDDLEGHLEELRSIGMPESMIERRRLQVEGSDDRRIRTGWLSPIDDPDDDGEEER